MARADIQADIDLDSSGFRKGIKKSQRSVRNFVDGATSQFLKLGATFASIGLVKNIISLGTSAAETASKFRAVFGPAADEMNEKINQLKETIPASTKEMQDALATFGQMAQSFGLNSKAANEFSVNMVKIAGDIASFHNLRPEEAFLKLRSAISGEFEPMKQLGIVLNQAMVEQEAFNLKIADGTEKLNASQKAIAVQSLLIKQMGVANGDAAATADSAANSIKFLIAELKDLGAEIGETSLPAVVKLVEAMALLLKFTQKRMDIVGTEVGAAVFGRPEEDELGGYRESAKQKLKREGRLKFFGRGRKKQIEEEAKLLKASVDARVAANKEARDAANQLADAEDQVTDAVADPTRANAANEYLQSLKEQIELAEQLTGEVQKAQKEETFSKSRFDPRKDHMSQTEIDTLEAQKKTWTGPRNLFESRFDTAPISPAQSAMVGGITADEKRSTSMGDPKKEKEAAENQLESIKEIERIITKLDNALQS